jgi:hypothetical protein
MGKAQRRVFKNFKAACQHYSFPGTHQHGSIGNEKGIIRSYTNGTVGKDFVKENEVFYRLKDERMRAKFSLNVESGQRLRLFQKVSTGVVDRGLHKVEGFTETHVHLVQVVE